MRKMENPKSRPAAAKLIDSVINKHHEDMQSFRAGWSLCMKIYDALVQAGYMIEPKINREDADCTCPKGCNGYHQRTVEIHE